MQVVTKECIDPMSGLPVRATDNGLKEGDLPGISQENKPLEYGENGLPVEWEVPKNA